MKLTKNLFEDVVTYIFAEPGAMGAAGSIECLKSNGESFIFFYIDEETNWQKTKECFDGINGCKFNGPHPKTFYKESLLSLGGNDEIVTKIKPGWKEIAFDAGNHFVCKKEYSRGFIDFFSGMKPYEIIVDGMNKIKKEHFYEKLDDIANAFYRQEEADQELTLKLEELNKNPEYVKRIKECTREQGVDAMLLVLKEFGVEITFMELKQYGFRKAGLM